MSHSAVDPTLPRFGTDPIQVPVLTFEAKPAEAQRSNTLRLIDTSRPIFVA